MRNPHTTWAGVLSLGILAGLAAYLAHQGTLSTEIVTVVSALASAGGLNALGNIFSKDGDQR